MKYFKTTFDFRHGSDEYFYLKKSSERICSFCKLPMRFLTDEFGKNYVTSVCLMLTYKSAILKL